MRRRRRRGGAVLRAIQVQGDRIVAAIEKASTDARDHRESLIRFAADALRDALAEGARRGIVTVPGMTSFVGNDVAVAVPEVPRASPPERSPGP